MKFCVGAMWWKPGHGPHRRSPKILLCTALWVGSGWQLVATKNRMARALRNPPPNYPQGFLTSPRHPYVIGIVSGHTSDMLYPRSYRGRYTCRSSRSVHVPFMIWYSHCYQKLCVSLPVRRPAQPFQCPIPPSDTSRARFMPWLSKNCN